MTCSPSRVRDVRVQDSVAPSHNAVADRERDEDAHRLVWAGRELQQNAQSARGENCVAVCLAVQQAVAAEDEGEAGEQVRNWSDVEVGEEAEDQRDAAGQERQPPGEALEAKERVMFGLGPWAGYEDRRGEQRDRG